MRILNDEEIRCALNQKPFDCVEHITLTEGYINELKEIAKAQYQRDINCIAEWWEGFYQMEYVMVSPDTTDTAICMLLSKITESLKQLVEKE